MACLSYSVTNNHGTNVGVPTVADTDRDRGTPWATNRSSCPVECFGLKPCRSFPLVLENRVLLHMAERDARKNEVLVK